MDPLARLKILINSSTPIVVMERVEEVRVEEEWELPLAKFDAAAVYRSSTH